MLHRHTITIAFSVTILLLLSGCASEQSLDLSLANTDTPTMLPHTATVTPTSSPTLTPTPASTRTLTLTPTSTCTLAPTMTPTPTPTLLGGYPGQYLLPDSGHNSTMVNLYNADGSLVETIYEYFINPDDFGEDYIRLEVSPSGEAVCVLYEHDEANMLALLRSDGTQIATMDTRLSFYGAQADWSPDGQWLAFTSRGNNTYTDIYIIDANGENLRQLTNNHAANSSPFFLPLGEDIIYWEDSSPRVMNLSDGSIHYTDYSRSWTQDEQYYLYSPSAQRVELRNAETHARQTIYVPQNPHHYIYQTIITRDGNWALIGEYDPAGETILSFLMIKL